MYFPKWSLSDIKGPSDIQNTDLFKYNGQSSALLSGASTQDPKLTNYYIWDWKSSQLSVYPFLQGLHLVDRTCITLL